MNHFLCREHLDEVLSRARRLGLSTMDALMLPPAMEVHHPVLDSSHISANVAARRS
jgi:hypothetical protein